MSSLPAHASLSTDRAMHLLVELLRRLFTDRIAAMKATPVMRRFEKDMFVVLGRLGQAPDQTLEGLPLGVQRLVYEMVAQYVMMYAQTPGQVLSVAVSSDMNDDQILSILLRQEIISRSWPYPQSVPL